MIRKQKTFEKCSYAIDYLNHLDFCFTIRKAIIRKIYDKKWDLYNWRLIVEYE